MSEQAFDEALDELRAGHVVAAATESFFGLLADAANPQAVTRVLALKPRADKGVPLILPDAESWPGLVRELPELALRLARAFWPGPLSLTLSAAPGVDPRLLLDDRIAVRHPAPSPAWELARALGRPLCASSANPPGEPPARTSEEVEPYFRAELARGELHLLAGVAPGRAPSSVVIVDAGGFRVVREGALSTKEIAARLARD